MSLARLAGNPFYGGCTALVSGGRFYGQRWHLNGVLNFVHRLWGITKLVHGDCRRWDDTHANYLGADHFADLWAKERGIAVQPYPAQWDVYGKSAGHRRNLEMWRCEYIDILIAFPGHSGHGRHAAHCTP